MTVQVVAALCSFILNCDEIPPSVKNSPGFDFQKRGQHLRSDAGKEATHDRKLRPHVYRNFALGSHSQDLWIRSRRTSTVGILRTRIAPSCRLPCPGNECNHVNGTITINMIAFFREVFFLVVLLIVILRK